MATGTATFTLIHDLVDKLAARPGLTGVQVLDAYPTSGIGREAIWAEDADSDNEIPVMRAGVKKVDESVNTNWVLQVLRNDGSSQRVADLRANVLFGEFQQQLAEDPQVNETDLQWAQLAGWQMQRGLLATGGHGVRIEITLNHRARLEP